MSDILQKHHKKKLDAVLRANNATSFSAMLRERHGIRGEIDNSIVSCHSGYNIPTFNEVVTKSFFKQPLGLICQSKACGLSASHLIGEEKICHRCYETGFPTNSDNGWSKIFCPVRSLSLQPELLATLMCRNSRGSRVYRKSFTELKDLVYNNMREIQNFIGFNIQIRIVSEVAGHGSAMAEPKTMYHFCGMDEQAKYTPLSQMIDVVSILYRQGDMLAFVMHCPGSFTAKVANMLAYHNDLVENGIPLNTVIYICYGVEIGQGAKGWGTIENLSIFSAAQFNEFIKENTGKNLKASNSNDIHGFCTGMLKDWDGRKSETTRNRSCMVGKKKK